MCVVGAREDGTKELVGMELGYRESTESWGSVLRGLRDRGMDAPLLAIGDGALGLWSALDQVYPTTGHQRCWNHRALNLAARLPKSLQSSTRKREVSHAPTRAECERLRDEYVSELRTGGRGDAAETVLRDWAVPAWVSLIPSYPVYCYKADQDSAAEGHQDSLPATRPRIQVNSQPSLVKRN